MSIQNDPDDDFYQSKQFLGAMLGARAGTSVYGIEIDDDIRAQVAISVLIGFFAAGGFEPETVDVLRGVIARAASRTEH